MTHTEKVHVIFGLAAAFTGLLALHHAYYPRSRARFAWPVLTFAIGFFLFIPVEAQTRTYQEVGWWDTLLSAVPDSPSYWLHNWFAKLDHWHVIQHKVGGILIMAVGVVEALRAHGRLGQRPWAMLLPALLVGIGLAFGVHGGSREHLPHRSEQVHHWLFGAGFVLAGLTLWLHHSGVLRGAAFRGTWAMCVLLVGLDIAFFYRLTPSELEARKEHHHESAGSRLR